MSEQARLLRALLRHNLSAFAQKTFQVLEPGTIYFYAWYLDHLAWQLMRVARGDVRRLIINMPPRSMKSITVSVAFTAWLLGRDPTKRIVAVSYAQELARKLSIDTRRIMEEPWFAELFPSCQLVSRRQRDIELTTTQRGGRLAVGLGGALTGFGGDIIVVDDPMKAQDALSMAERRRVIEVFEGTLLSRLNQQAEGAIVIVAQRLHEEDLCGYLLERAADDWEVVTLPAIATEDGAFRLSDREGHLHFRSSGDVLQPEREPLEVLESLRRQLGPMTFSAQYQQAPVPAGGHVIRREWLHYFEDAELPDAFSQTIASWDTASSLEEGDWSVGTVWGAIGLDYYLLDVFRERLEVPDLRRAIVRLTEHWGANATLIEDAGIGRAVAQDLCRTGELRPLLPRPRFDKRARLEAQSTRFATGQVHLPAEAPWLASYVSELLAFPFGRHDDQVDSTSQALHFLTDRTVPPRPLTRRNITRRTIIRR